MSGSAHTVLRSCSRSVRRCGLGTLHQKRSFAQVSNAPLNGFSDETGQRVRLRDGTIEIVDPLDASVGIVYVPEAAKNKKIALNHQQSRKVAEDKDIGVVTHLKSKGALDLEATFKDGHITNISIPALIRRRTQGLERLRSGTAKVSPWTSSISENPPAVSFSEVQQGNGLGKLLLLIKQYGFAFVEDLPPTPNATEALLEQIGPIRNTHYGAFYDFTSDLSSKDTAYTAEALEPHTDTTYFSEPIGLQALHLLSHTNGSGGLSSLVDGFNAAYQLRDQHPEYYKILSRIGVYAHASGNEGISIQPMMPQPTLTHYPTGDPLEGELMQVRWNNADRAGVAANFNELDRWYEAAGKFDELLGDEKNQYWFQLKPGKCLIFDNWRALHGRSEFTGKRRMCGGYINRDDFISRLRMTNLSQEEIQASTVTG